MKTIRERVDELNWVHQIDLGSGIVTPGRWPPHPLIMNAFNSIDFKGKKVLDIGAWDGLWSFEAERRGASKVVATDLISQRSYSKMPTFSLAHDVLQSQVEYHPDLSVFEIERLGIKDFDVIIFCGVYYHLRHPLRALAIIRRVMREGGVVIVEGDAIINSKRPHAWFLYDDLYSNDPSNWWVPTTSCLTQWIRSCYFDIRSLEVLEKSPSSFQRFKEGVKTIIKGWEPRVSRAVVTATAKCWMDPGYCFPDDELSEFDTRKSWDG
ncbi:MAG: DUF1698 domain-containing protein [Planctomycetota bacterium]|jgi:tRNA (mo5U34)-methyltransferase